MATNVSDDRDLDSRVFMIGAGVKRRSNAEIMPRMAEGRQLC
jgi:hypothetical protein